MWVRTGTVTSEKYEILIFLRVVLCTIDSVRRDLGSCDDLQLRQLLLELRDLAFLLLRIFIAEGLILSRRLGLWPHVDHGIFQPPEVLPFLLVFGVLDAEKCIKFKILMTRFPCLPLTFLCLQTFVFSLPSLPLLRLLPELSRKSNIELRRRDYAGCAPISLSSFLDFRWGHRQTSLTVHSVFVDRGPQKPRVSPASQVVLV